jgi:hypothetical protein
LFCSELVLTALQQSAPIYKQYIAHKTPPTELHKIIGKHGRFILSIFDDEKLKDVDIILENDEDFA